jgi:hypothetical protein
MVMYGPIPTMSVMAKEVAWIKPNSRRKAIGKSSVVSRQLSVYRKLMADN